MASSDSSNDLLRLHIGGVEPRPGWKILNIQSGAGVDFVGDCMDLSRFADGSVEEIYASHVYEHLGYVTDLDRALGEAARVLRRGGILRMSVPNFETLCRMFVHPQLNIDQRFHVMRMIYGGQIDAHDFHRVGLTAEFLGAFLTKAGFSKWRTVDAFGIFADMSELKFGGIPISLNVEAVR